MLRRYLWLGTALILAAGIVPVTATTPKFTTLASVPGSPMVGVVHAGVVYGTEASGGTGSGYLFAFPLKTRQFSDIHDFSGGADGGNPNGSLDVDTAGDLFGLAQTGGSASAGTLFEFDTTHVLKVLHTFGIGNDGEVPMQGMVRLGNGTFFGATRLGTPANDGNIFELKGDGTYVALHDFLSGADGHCPFGGVARDAHGNIYGTTWGGNSGGNPSGSVFEITTKGVLTTLYVFKNQSDGEWPDIAPTVDKHGNVYGSTRVQNGGIYAGAIWKIDPQGTFTLLHVLNGTTDGSQPNAPMVVGADGNLYGTAYKGGSAGQGVFFQITPSGVYTVIHDFTGGADRGLPTGSLAVSGRKIFGGTNGSIFQYAY